MTGVGAVAGSHRIQWGDTLSELAVKFSTTVDKLVAANKNIHNRDLIFAGEMLNVPGRSSQFPRGDAATNVSFHGGGATPWMDIAYKYVGEKENSPGSNPFIEQCHASTGLGRADDSVPWCSSFVNYVMEKAGYKGTDSAMAISWANWGEKVGSLSQARPGDIVVLHGPSGNHVGFFVSDGNGGVTLLGGNQSDQVKESTFNLGSYHIVAIRRPSETVIV